MKVFTQHRTINGMLAGQTMSASLPVKNRRYDWIVLTVNDGAEVFADDTGITDRISKIRLRADGITLHEYDPATILRLGEFYGFRKHGHRINIPLARFEFNVEGEAAAFGLGTQDLGNLTLEVDLKAGVWITGPDIRVHYLYEPSIEPLGRHIRILQHVYGSSISTGQFSITDLLPSLRPQNRTVGLVGLHFNTRSFGDFQMLLDGKENLGFVHQHEFETATFVQTDRMASRYFDTAFTQLDFAAGSVPNILNLTGVGSLEFKMNITSALASGMILTSEVMHTGL